MRGALRQPQLLRIGCGSADNTADEEPGDCHRWRWEPGGVSHEPQGCTSPGVIWRGRALFRQVHIPRTHPCVLTPCANPCQPISPKQNGNVQTGEQPLRGSFASSLRWMWAPRTAQAALVQFPATSLHNKYFLVGTNGFAQAYYHHCCCCCRCRCRCSCYIISSPEGLRTSSSTFIASLHSSRFCASTYDQTKRFCSPDSMTLLLAATLVLPSLMAHAHAHKKFYMHASLLLVLVFLVRLLHVWILACHADASCADACVTCKQVRAGEGESEAENYVLTNPVAKTSMSSGLSQRGKAQVRIHLEPQ